MMAQGGNRGRLTKQLQEDFHPYLTVFPKIGKIGGEIIISIMKNT